MLKFQITCLVFFQDNPNQWFTLLELSKRLKADKHVLEPNLNHFVALTILEKELGDGIPTYRYFRPKDVIFLREGCESAMLECKRVDPINIESLLDHDSIEQHYQPIIDLSTNEIYSHESLMRNRHRLDPAIIFRAAIEKNRLYEMDAFCISKSIRSYFALDGDRDGQTLFVNIFPSSILNRLFVPFLENLMDQMQISSSCIVFELNETKEEEEIWETAALKQKVALLRKNGFRIAMDDVGDGTANLRKIVEFVPDFIKMSRYFSSRLSTSERKQRILKLFVDYCGKDTRMVLEGIENPDDLACAKNLGIALGQGYLLGKPEALQVNL